MKEIKNKDMFKNKKVIGIICVAIGLLVGCVIMPAINNITSGTIYVIRAKTSILAGDKITSAMVQPTQVGITNLPVGTATSLTDVVGKYAAKEIDKDDTITKAKLSDTNTAYSLKNGQKMMSFKICDFANGLSGKIQAGDIISIYVPSSSTSTSSKTEDPLPPELQYVKVATTTASDGEDVNGATVTQTTSSDSSTTLPATITVYVTDAQAKKLAQATTGTTYVALVCRGNDKEAAKLLKEQTEILSKESNDNQPAASNTTSSAVVIK